MDEFIDVMTYPRYLQQTLDRPDLDTETTEGVAELTSNWIHNLQHLSIDPQVYVWSRTEAGEFEVKLALRTTAEWEAIEHSALVADREAQIERAIQQAVEQLFGPRG